MPRLGSFSFSAASPAATLLFLWLQSVAVLHARSMAASGDDSMTSQRRFSESPTAGKVADDAFRGNSPAVDVKVDIFLDLACPDSAAAWTTIKQIVWNSEESRTEVVLHVLPKPGNQMAFDTAKAVQAVEMFSTDSEEVALFLDAMFDYHPLILDGAGENVARPGFRGILTKWALAAGSITQDQFESVMETSEIDLLVRYENEAAPWLGVHTTPTALINANFMVILIGAKLLENFRLLLVTVGTESLPPYGSQGARISEPIEGRWILEDDIDDDTYLKHYGIDGDSNHPQRFSEEFVQRP